MIENGILQIFEKVDYNFAKIYNQNRSNPCIVFCGNPSLQFGDILNLMKIFDKFEKNKMILIEKTNEKIISELKFKNLKISYFYLNMNLNLNEINNLINEIKPNNIVSKQFFQENSKNNIFQQHINSNNFYNLSYLNQISINLIKKYEFSLIDENLTRNIFPLKYLNEINLSKLNGELLIQDNEFFIKDFENKNEFHINEQKYLFGQININDLILSLEKNGYSDYAVSKLDYNTYTISINKLNSKIIFTQSETIIECDSINNLLILKNLFISNNFLIL
jgi:integrator complex subunit 9